MKDKLAITAHKVIEDPMPIRTAGRQREWMDNTESHFAYRCLPLAVANQMGWELLSPTSFSASWNGKNGLDAIKFRFDEQPSPLVGSHFGYGVLTFTLGYLFRTSKSHNIWVKGPCNQPKDGIAALEGVIETDWTPYTFTMNWQFTRKRHKVRFEKGETVASVLPYPRHYLGKFTPRLKNINEDPKLYAQYVKWREERIAFNEQLKDPNSEAAKSGWQRSYMKGEDQMGNTFAGHETKIRIRDFE